MKVVGRYCNAGAVAIVICAAFTLALGACASKPSDPDALAAYKEANDPLEPMNRQLFRVNQTLDEYALEPVAIAYRDYVPEMARDGVGNFFDNLGSPVIFANDLLQAKPGRAADTLFRAVINTTIGIGGLLDPATRIGVARHSEDFGQTLAVWGVPSGPYLFIPLLGPRPPRDLAGFGVDQFLDPVTYLGGSAELPVSIGSFAGQGIHARSEVIDTLDELEETSVDFYAAIRSFYRQNRRNEIRDGAPDFENMPDFEFEDEDLDFGEPAPSDDRPPAAVEPATGSGDTPSSPSGPPTPSQSDLISSDGTPRPMAGS